MLSAATTAPPSDRGGPEPISAARRTAAAVAALGLPGASDRLPPAPLDERSWAALVEISERDRLDGLLERAVSQGALAVTDAQRREVHDRHARAMWHALRLEGHLLHLSAALTRAGIDHRVIKGPALAHTAYPDPSLRPFADLDVLVPSAEFERVATLCTDAGAVRPFDQPRPGFEQRFAKGTNLVTVDGLAVDLHRSLAAGPFGQTLRLDDLFTSAASFSLAGRSIPCLPPELTVVQVALNAALGDWPPKLVVQRDLVQLLTSPTLDRDEVVAVAEAWAVQAPLADALLRAAEVLRPPDDPLVEWARTLRPTTRERRWLSLYQCPERGYRHFALATAVAIPRWRDRAAYLRALALPDRRFLARREGTYRSRLRAGLGLAAHGARPTAALRRAGRAPRASGPWPRGAGR